MCIFFFFLIYVGCPGQLTRTTTILHGPLDILQAQEQVRHRGDDRRTHRGSNPEQERNKSHELTTTVKLLSAGYTQELEPGTLSKAKPVKATDLQAPCVRCVFSVDEMRPIDVVCPSLIKKWFKILCVCVCVCVWWMLQVPKLEERILESLFESPWAVCCITNLSYYYVLSPSHNTVVRKLLYLLWCISFQKKNYVKKYLSYW